MFRQKTASTLRLSLGCTTLAVTSALALAGCGAFQTKSKGEKAKENSTPLAAAWNGPCVKNDFLNLSHAKESLTFSAVGDFDKTSMLYTDDNCGAPLMTMTQHGVYADLGASQKVQGANDINFQVNAVSMTPNTDDAATTLNRVQYCGVTNWAKGQETDVLGKNCAGKTFSKGEVLFDVYRLEQDNSRLALGKGLLFVTGASANDRPTALDEQNPFAKQ